MAEIAKVVLHSIGEGIGSCLVSLSEKVALAKIGNFRKSKVSVKLLR